MTGLSDEKGWAMKRPWGFTPFDIVSAARPADASRSERTRDGRCTTDPFTRYRTGFTLLELMLVIIIIGTLASMALPEYLRVAERARVVEALVVLSAIRGSELRYKAQPTSGASYTEDPAELDVGLPSSSQWDFGVEIGTPSYAVATRDLENIRFGGATVKLNIDTGATCTSNSVYGLDPCPL